MRCSNETKLFTNYVRIRAADRVVCALSMPRHVSLDSVAKSYFKVFWGALISAKNQKKTELGKGLVMA